MSNIFDDVMNSEVDDDPQYPLYPNLKQEGRDEAQALIDSFKQQMLKIAQDTLDQIYCDVAVYIESDSWQNYRNKIMSGLRNYKNRHKQSEWDYKTIRQAIYEEHKEEINKDLNQDLLNRIRELEKDNEALRDSLSRRW